MKDAKYVVNFINQNKIFIITIQLFKTLLLCIGHEIIFLLQVQCNIIIRLLILQRND